MGGTLAHADRLAELPAVAVVVGAELVAQGPKGKRVIPAAEFFLGDLTTALKPDEMLREIRFPVERGSIGSAFVETSIRHHDLMLLGIAARLEFAPDGRCTSAGIAVVGGCSAPSRLRKTEAYLAAAGALDDAAIGEAARLSLDDVELEGDLYASARYRRRVMEGLIERALRDAVATRASHAS
jgi:carbon-monoxide dehydrogenase medium subunit